LQYGAGPKRRKGKETKRQRPKNAPKDSPQAKRKKVG